MLYIRFICRRDQIITFSMWISPFVSFVLLHLLYFFTPNLIEWCFRSFVVMLRRLFWARDVNFISGCCSGIFLSMWKNHFERIFNRVRCYIHVLMRVIWSWLWSFICHKIESSKKIIYFDNIEIFSSKFYELQEKVCIMLSCKSYFFPENFRKKFYEGLVLNFDWWCGEFLHDDRVNFTKKIVLANFYYDEVQYPSKISLECFELKIFLYWDVDLNEKSREMKNNECNLPGF